MLVFYFLQLGFLFSHALTEQKEMKVFDDFELCLKIYNRRTRVEHVDNARKSATHCVNALLEGSSEP